MPRGWSHSRHWNPGEVEQEIMMYARRIGRMPTTDELRADGNNALSVRASREPGGMRGLAARLGLALSGGETHRGQEIEDLIAAELVAAGFGVQRQTTRAPFDLLVDGVRVDVKSGAMTMPRTHVFALSKIPPTCDLYIAVCVDEMNRPLARYYIPASAAHVRTLSITERGKWSQYRDDLGQLRALIEQRAAGIR